MRFFLFLALSIAIAGCRTVKVPEFAFSADASPAAPNYSQVHHWAAHPSKLDNADLTPSSALRENQENVKADVFFIHPTIYKSDRSWNASLDDVPLNKKVDRQPILHQASIFNEAGRIFAPRYRQATLGVFRMHDKLTQYKVIDLAYQDVKSAFEFYLKNENKGRPFILASHSQGSVHNIRLIKELIDGKDLSRQLVCAYIVGWPVPADTFKVLRPCENESETGCVMSWTTFEWGYVPPWIDTTKTYIVTNPLNWKSGESYAGMELQKGMLMGNYKKMFKNKFDSKSGKHVLWIHKPDVPGKSVIKTQNYHIADYNLFWINVRENAVHRVEEFLKINP